MPATRADVEAAKCPLYQLAFDGITLVTVENGRARYTIKDLAEQNAGRDNPLARPPRPDESPNAAMLRNVEDCFRDGQAIRDAFVRPNEVYLGNANRTDLFFQAPLDAAGNVYTILSQEVLLHTDNFQQRLQISLDQGQDEFNPPPVDEVVGYVRVSGEPVPGGRFDVMSLRDVLPDVPPFLQPVDDSELQIPADEAARRGVAAGAFRTRVVSYSGLGGAEFPLIEVPDAFAEAHPELEMLVWANFDGTRLLLPPLARTMAVNSRFDLAASPEPPAPRKFVYDDPEHIRALVETGEEWVLYNNSMTLWSHTDRERFPEPGLYRTHYRGYPLSRAEGQMRHARDSEFQITAKAADHPFHIHINPCWVTRIEIPDELGRLHNVLDEPRWMDTVPIPRNGGRVVFRTRFVDFVGKWIHHCHILLHEDNGMMEMVEATARAEETNYRARTRVASHGLSSEDVSTIYPRPSRDVMYRQNLHFVDVGETGQVYPGFPVEVPRLDEDS